MKPEDTIDFPIRWAWHKISRLYNTEAQKIDISMSIGYVLLNIDLDGGTPSTKLGPRMGMESRSLTRTLKSMEDGGLIERVQDEIDRRMVRVCLTPLGETKRQLARKTVIAFNEHLQSLFTDRERKQFASFMKRLNNTLDDTTFFKNLIEVPEHLLKEKP